ncbi:MAG: hypothetical protein M1834_002839 [Cirrosporium novae-zelandiae]|nr:MAG: hypothetical protein M1834_002839 [Cirrosporium novae-zelandiae]
MSSLFGEAPSSINLKDNRTPGDNAAVIILLVIANIAVGARLASRRIQRASLVAHDYLIMIALLMVYATTALSITGGYFGAGKHVWVVSTPNLVTIVKILFAYTWIYGCSVSFTKLSILFFYRRIFGTQSRPFNICIYVCGFLAGSYPLMIWGTMLGACRPLHYYWDQYQDLTLEGTCIDVNKFFLIAGIMNMATDVIILIVPIPKIYHLQISKGKRLSISGIMLLGGFVCVASVVRISYLVTLQTAIDVTWIMGPVFIWSSVEPAIGILSACLPLMRPLIRFFIHDFLGSSNKRSNTGGLESTQGWMSNRNRSKLKSSRASVDQQRDFGQLSGFSTRIKRNEEDDEIQLTDQPKSMGYNNGKRSIIVKTQIDQSSSVSDTSETGASTLGRN